MNYFLRTFFIFCLVGWIPMASVFADSTDEIVESLYDDFETQESKKAERKSKAKKSSVKEMSEEEFNKLSDLVKLSDFNDVAVIQRRFLPKTGRFELSGVGLITTNNAFFNNFGVGVRFSYYFIEKLGLELNYFLLQNTKRSVTTNLEDNQNIETQSLVVSKNYAGASFKWSPIYGKVAIFNEKIVPFDIYFAPGLGLTQTDQGGSEMTVSLGTGQIFALSKSTAVRWDFVWNFFQTEVDQGSSKVTKNHNDLFFSIGYSFFFPEATYR